MIPTPGQPKRHYGLGAVNYHTGETVVIIRRRKRRIEVAELLQLLVDKLPPEPSTSLGTTPVPTRTMKWKPWSEQLLDVLCYFICQPTVRG
jgi:hypothetical protein